MSNDKEKETALTVIDAAAKNGSLICFDRKNGFPQVELYRTEITAINIDKEEQCFEINKKFMPKREVVDRIGEAAGVIFIMGETRAQTLDDSACGKHTAYIGIAQGKVRLSDGTWRKSSICEYEFNPTTRAMLEYEINELTPETKKLCKTYTTKEEKKERYKTGKTLATAILENQKMARQRANTGARLRVIRELAGLPCALTDKQISKPIIFGRIVQNTSYLLQTQEGRLLASAMACGADIPALFGKAALTDNTESGNEPRQHEERNVTPESEGESGETGTAPQESNMPDFPDPEPSKDTAEFDQLTLILNEFLEEFKDKLNGKSRDGKNPYELAQAELADSNATVESRSTMIVRIRAYLEKQGIQA